MTARKLSLTEPKDIHIIGIGGAGMRSIALVLSGMGHRVKGSDLKYSSGLERLKSEGIEIYIGHSEKNLLNASILTKSTAIPEGNVEVQEAKRKGIDIFSRAEVLSAISQTKKTIAVAGTHGKTTTSSMLSLALAEAGVNPSFLIGGEVNEIGCGALWDKDSKFLVVEADESDGTFLEVEAEFSIVTSVEPDHLSYYGTSQKLREAFKQFVSDTKKKTYICDEDVGTEYLLDDKNVVTYGTSQESDYSLQSYTGGRFSSSFEIVGPETNLGPFTLASPGLHNALNATAAVALGVDIGLPVEDLRRGISHFAGVARRFQFRGEANGVAYIDDYAHLPSEVKAALKAASEGEWGRIIAVFQPHRYTRTYELADAFSDCFEYADEVIITGIYPSGEKPIPGVTGKLIADSLKTAGYVKPVHYCEHRQEIIELLYENLQQGDLCITLGAGDLTSLPNEMMEA
ncbi:MAG: UDP-N-acetylmuramate--L-alanine ligase [Actinomycetota bacterium]|nr:UDP-N-acetylmuramate--L-alanine ligase [Actinomycetota bacterium]